MKVHVFDILFALQPTFLDFLEIWFMGTEKFYFTQKYKHRPGWASRSMNATIVFVLAILSHLILTNSALSHPNVAFRYDGAPDALVFEVCGIYYLKEMLTKDVDGWGIGMRCCLRANDTLIDVVSLIWNSLSNSESCFTVSVDPDRIMVAGYLKVQALICSWKRECEFGIESEEVNIQIEKIVSRKFPCSAPEWWGR
jgi:hypothetical protein